MDELLVVTTGGTIDKVYFDDKSDYQVGEPQIGRILQALGVAFRFSVIPIIRKDSLHINEADRELLRARQRLLAEHFDVHWQWWPRERVRERLRSERYHEALFEPQALHFHPLKYAHGIAALAADLGVRVHEHTAVARVAQTGEITLAAPTRTSPIDRASDDTDWLKSARSPS